MSSSESINFFLSVASQAEVTQDDLDILATVDVHNCKQFYFNMPSETALENLIEDVFSKVRVERDDDGIPRVVDILDEFGQPKPEEPRAFSRLSRVGKIRRLWGVARDMAKEDMKEIVATLGNVPVPRQINRLVLRGLIEQATTTGLPKMTAKTNPGPLTVSKVWNNFVPRGPWKYLSWEEYVSEEDQDRFERHPSGPPASVGLRVFRSDEGYM